MEICQRCGEIGEDRRTLYMACFYAMEELNVPFEEEVVFQAELDDLTAAKAPVKVDTDENNSITLVAGTVTCKGELTPKHLYTLRVCKDCRAEWMNAIKQWFNAKKSVDRPTGTGVYVRKNGTNVELNEEEVEEWKVAHGGAEPCRVVEKS